jgi:ABC-type nitrate/sulfonate/bicarbonate transport system substrate-binding protein
MLSIFECPVRSRTALLAILIMIGMLRLTPSEAGDLTSMRVAYTLAAPWLLAWTAKDKGIFEKHGLNVSFTDTQNLSLLPGVVGKQNDIAPSTP